MGLLFRNLGQIADSYPSIRHLAARLDPDLSFSDNGLMQKTTLWLSLIALSFAFSGSLLTAQTPHNHPSKMSITKAPFGKTKAGQSVDLYTLNNANGLTAKVITYGAIIYSLEAPDKDGHFANLTANCASLADYEDRSPCFGALIGRYANRIAKGKFTLDGRQYSLPLNGGANHIHGGPRGFDKQVWKAEPIQSADFVGLKLTYTSNDGENGYPGTLNCTVTYELNNRNEWKMEYTATTDKATPVNISNHAYWNLAGVYSGKVLDQVLSVNADKYLLADETLIPTGQIMPVEGTPLDFRKPHPIGERINQIKEKQFNAGYDHCLVLNHKSPDDLTFAAKLKDPKSRRSMEVFTTEPGVQIFTANFGPGAFAGPEGYSYPRNLGLCLECQHYPDSPNQPGFPSTILRPGRTYHAVTIHKFGVEP
jgi:aldose 1-epimerase